MAAGEILGGLKELFAYYEAEKDRIGKQKKQVVIDACELVASTAKMSMAETTRTTDILRAVKKTKSGKMHYPSEPGHPPAPDIPNLIKTVKYIIIEEKTKVIGEVGSFGTDYATALEYGRKDGHFAPRPWLRPALEKNEGKIRKNFIEALK